MLKAKLGLVLLVAGFVVVFANQQRKNIAPDFDGESSTQQTSSQPAEIAVDGSFFSSSLSSGSPSSTATSRVNNISSAATSSLNSLSGARVDPLPEIANFLRQLDSVIVPKIYLPIPKREFGFDYAKAEPSELRERALKGDPYAAYFYAEYVVKNNVRTVSDTTGAYVYEGDYKKRVSGMTEAREFYIRGLRGGIASLADVLSRLYATSLRGGNRVESLAWRKVSFAIGEGERYNCLRNSTTCVVKDFNNLNRLEFFYPCLSYTGDSCTQSDYEAAMVLAAQYADSLEFAMNHKVAQ